MDRVLECSADSQRVVNAFLHAYPASEFDICVPGIVFVALAGPAQFQETGVTLAIFFRKVEIVVRCSGCAVEFVIPAKAYVIGLVFLVMLRPAEADAAADGVSAVEVVLGLTQVAVDIYVVTENMGPEEFRVNVVGVVPVGIELAQAQLGCDVVRVRVVADVVPGDIGSEVCLTW